MEILKVEIQAWTASFRHPLFISGRQITLKIPPLSTVHGILSCAVGEYLDPSFTQVGLHFQSRAIFEDLETIYMLDEKQKATSNICRRENLFDVRLSLYLTTLDLRSSFERPHYPLTIGRSTDLASVKSIEIVSLEKRKSLEYEKTLLPFSIGQIGASLVTLPRYFTDTIPRCPQGVGIFYLLERKKKIEQEGWVDPQTGKGVYLHSFTDEKSSG